MYVMLGNDLSAAIQDERQTTLMNQWIKLGPEIVRGDKKELDSPIPEQLLAALQNFKLGSLDIAVENVQFLDPVAFHQRLDTHSRYRDLPGCKRLEWRRWERRFAGKALDEFRR